MVHIKHWVYKFDYLLQSDYFAPNSFQINSFLKEKKASTFKSFPQK